MFSINMLSQKQSLIMFWETLLISEVYTGKGERWEKGHIFIQFFVFYCEYRIPAAFDGFIRWFERNGNGSGALLC